MWFFKPTFPTTKNDYIKTVLGFVAIVLRKNLPEKKEDGSFHLEADYIVKTNEILADSFAHLIDRLEKVGVVNRGGGKDGDTNSKRDSRVI